MIPNRLKILGYDYTVIEDKKLCRDENKCGWQCNTTQEICLDPTLNQQQIESTLLHEIIEAINYHSELGLKHEQITVLESNLYQVLRDNKLF